MRFAMIGISYKNTTMDIREQVVFTDTKKMEMYVALTQLNIRESVILSTCNRSEIYFLYDDIQQIQLVKESFIAFFPQVEIASYLFVKTGKEALSYLFEVCNGLHSLVLGEDQILGQVVKSEEFSRVNGSSKKIMNRIFRDAITCAKKAKTQFRISEHPLSLSYIGIQELEKQCGIKGMRVLVLGSGKMSVLAMNYLFEKQAQHVYNANRSVENAKQLVKMFPLLEVIPFVDRYSYINECDIIISATASPHVIIKHEEMPKLYKPLYIVDLAAPRDVDVKVKQIEQVHLYDMDHLQKSAALNNQKRLDKVKDIDKMIEQEVALCDQWVKSTRVDTTIQTLQERISEVSSDAYELLENKLNLSDHEKYILKKTLQTSMQRLMRDPIVTLKEADTKKQEAYHEAVKDLFHINN